MDPRINRKCGAAYKRARHEKEQREEAVLRKTRKIDELFKLSSKTPDVPSNDGSTDAFSTSSPSTSRSLAPTISAEEHFGSTPTQSGRPSCSASLPAVTDHSGLTQQSTLEVPEGCESEVALLHSVCQSSLFASNITNDFATSLPSTSSSSAPTIPVDKCIGPAQSGDTTQSPESVGKSGRKSQEDRPSDFNDPAEWLINDSTIKYLLQSGNINQNLDADFSLTKTYYPNQTRYRALSKTIFTRSLKNGEKQDRKYLTYSPSKKALFCIPCRLFGGTSHLATTGFCDWRNVNSTLSHHENSREHFQCEKLFFERSQAISRIDCELIEQIESEMNYWRSVLKRVVAVIKQLSTRCLPFRGSVEKFGSTHNGNYMMNLELIAEFDPFLAKHIADCGNPGSGKTSYLSSQICMEFVSLMSDKVTGVIADEVKKRKYFSLIVDSTPDISHNDQLSVIIRYVTDEPVERFLNFLPNVGHKAEDMKNAVVSLLESLDLDIRHCVGQSYDNASNMSGAYEGLQALIGRLSPLAEYVPCSGHSLNLVGAAAAECVLESVKFFMTLNHLYNFFAASTSRWELLSAILQPDQKVLKRVDGTRWSNRHFACSSFCGNRMAVLEALSKIENDVSQKPVVQCEVQGLIKDLHRFEFVFMSVFWNVVLRRFHGTSKKLQDGQGDLQLATALYEALEQFIADMRTEEMFNKFLHETEAITGETLRSETHGKRSITRKVAADETRQNETVLTGETKLRVTVYYPIIDSIQNQLKKRHQAYKTSAEKFNFLFQLKDLEPEVIREEARKLKEAFDEHLEDTFTDECLHFRHFLNTMTGTSQQSLCRAYKYLRDNHLEAVFPNVEIMLRIFLAKPITNCSAERSFSLLKRLKTWLRASLNEEHTSDLAVLAINSDLTLSLDFEGIIHKFASLKARRKMF